MRVAYICLDPGVPIFGCKGSSIHVQQIIRAMQRRGMNIEIFATKLGCDEPPDDLRSLICHYWPLQTHNKTIERENELVALNQRLQSELRKQGPFDLIYERFSLWSYAGLEFAKAYGIPSVLEVNSPLIEEQKQHRSLIQESLAGQLSQRAFRSAAVISTVSDAVAEYLERTAGAGCRVHVIPNGVDVRPFLDHPRTHDPQRSSDAPVIGFIGTLKPWHGVDRLLSAFERVHHCFPQAQLHIVGDGPQRELLMKQQSHMQAGTQSRIHWYGAVDHKSVPGILSQFEMGVAPYPHLDDFYFSPLKIYEYMAASLPVVASRIGQIPSIITHHVHGLLCQPGNPVALAAAICKLCADVPMLQEMGRRGRAKSEQLHTWDQVLDRIMNLVNQCQPLVVGDAARSLGVNT